MFCARATTTTWPLNSKGGVEGYKIKVLEIDNEYKVPPAIEAHERFKKEGAVLDGLYGTPQTAALTKKLEEDKILGTSPGFGTAAAADGKRYPYLFPIAATYWSQAPAAVEFVKKQLGGSLKGKKIAYLYLRQPGRARSRCRSSRIWQKQRGLRAAGPSPCRRRASRWARRCSTSRSATGPTSSSRTCSAASPSVSIKELKGKGYPLSKVIGVRLGLVGGRHRGRRRLRRRRGLPHDAVRRRRRRLPGHQGHQRDVQGAGQAGRPRRWRSASSTTAAS